MTVLGKILVFVNLIFSLLTGGLIVMVYSTRTNWKDSYTKKTNELAIVRAQYDAEFQVHEKAVREKETAVQALDREKLALTAAVAKGKDDVAKAQQEIEAYKTQHNSASQVNQASADELNRRKQEVEKLTALVSELEKKRVDIDRQMARLRDEAVSYRIQYDSAKARNTELLAQIEAKERELAAYRSQFGVARPAASQARTPLPEDVRGTIKSVQGDLATITPGSDAGVAVGAELYVYRLQPKPEYLGKLIIQAVQPHEAVGRLEGVGKAKVKATDEVAARLGK